MRSQILTLIFLFMISMLAFGQYHVLSFHLPYEDHLHVSGVIQPSIP